MHLYSRDNEGMAAKRTWRDAFVDVGPAQQQILPLDDEEEETEEELDVVEGGLAMSAKAYLRMVR